MRPHDSIRWNAYPALAAAAAFSGGIVLGKILAPPVWVSVTVLTSVVLAALSMRTRSIVSTRGLHLTICVLAAAAAAGAVRYVSYYSLPAHHVTRVAGQREVLLTGALEDEPRLLTWGVRFTLRVESLEGERASGLLTVQTDAAVTPPGVCDRVAVRGTLEELPHPRNPGDFDYGRFLARRKIFAVVEAREVTVLDAPLRHPICRAAELRSAVRARIRGLIHDEQARSVIEALVVGDRSVVDREVIDRFVRTGLLHLLAVSGLHVMIVGMILYRLLGPMLMRARLRWRSVEIVRSTVTAGILLTYMGVTGASPSVVRAVVMTILFTGATVFQRTAHPMNSLGAAALVILIPAPSQLFEPGFQLSFAAVAGILGVKIPFPEGGFAGRTLSGVAVTLAATAATLPIVIYHFGRVSLGGLLLNVVAVPVTSATLCSAIASLAASTVHGGLAGLFGAATEFLARTLLFVAEEGDRWLSWSYLRWSVGSSAIPIALGLGVAAIGCRRYVRTRWRLSSLALLVCTGALVTQLTDGAYRPRLDVIFLDVGQGDAILLKTPGGSTVLIDAGIRTPFGDSGTRVLLPVLEHLGISRIHTVIATHPDADHLGGLPTLIRAVPVDRLLHNGTRHTSDLYEEVTMLLDSASVFSTSLAAGDTVLVDDRVRMSVLHPGVGRRSDDPNDNSIVLHVTYGETSFLLMGDAPVGAEHEVIERYGTMLDGDVLKVGHHGSETSTSTALVSLLRERGTKYAVVSVAGRNRYGLPDSAVVRRIRSAGIQTFATSKSGAVWFRSDGGRIDKVEWRSNQ